MSTFDDVRQYALKELARAKRIGEGKGTEEDKENSYHRVTGFPDPEMAHGIADDTLCEVLIRLGFRDVVDAYEEVDKWYA